MVASLIGALILALAPLSGARDDAQSATPRALEPQDPDRPALAVSDLKSLRDTNIFSPPKPKRDPRPGPGPGGSKPPPPPPEPARPKPPALTGIIFDVRAGVHVALVEDKNPAPRDARDPDFRFFKEPRFLKAGEEVAGVRIESVEIGKVVIRHGDSTKELKVGEPLFDLPKAPEGAALPPSAAPGTEAKPEARPPDPAPSKPFDAAQGKPLDAAQGKPAEAADVQKTLEELKKKNEGLKKKRNYDTDEP